jgi:hypothetical protein
MKKFELNPVRIGGQWFCDLSSLVPSHAGAFATARYDFNTPKPHGSGGWRRPVQPLGEDPLRVLILLMRRAPARAQPHPRTGRGIERLGKNTDTPFGGRGVESARIAGSSSSPVSLRA